MTKLSDTQLVILSAATQREDRNVLPLPGSLRGGAAAKVVGALLSRGLIAETTIASETKADAALNRIWRNDEDGRAILLHITDAGRAAIGVEPEGGDSAPAGADAHVTKRPGDPFAEIVIDAPAEGVKSGLPLSCVGSHRLVEVLPMSIHPTCNPADIYLGNDVQTLIHRQGSASPPSRRHRDNHHEVVEKLVVAPQAGTQPHRVAWQQVCPQPRSHERHPASSASY